jgi:hypothetical protein
MTRLDQLQGTWRRSLIEWPNGDRDVTTRVTWLQGPSFYADLRQPSGTIGFNGVRALRDLDAAQVEALAGQEGFAGILVQHEDCFEWTRQIDFQPKPIYSDRGTLVDHGGVMIERGCDIDYVEHWHRVGGGHTSAAALRLSDRRSGCLALIVCAGGRFMFARSRGAALDESRHLLEYVREARSLTEAQDLVDCELSLGTIGARWLIEHSSLPFRVGAGLSLRLKGESFVTADVTPAGRPIERAWSILSREGNIDEILGAANAVHASGDL